MRVGSNESGQCLTEYGESIIQQCYNNNKFTRTILTEHVLQQIK